MKLVLILSHGQAGVERGFSMNRNVGKQNLKEETFVSLRVVYDHIRVVSGLANVKIDKALTLFYIRCKKQISCASG